MNPSHKKKEGKITENLEDTGIITDVYLSKDINDYIYNINRPILHLKTISGGELKALACSQLLENYMLWVTNSVVKKKIEQINAMFRNCPNSEESVRKLLEKL